MGGAANTVSKWIPNEVKKAIPIEIAKAIPKEIAPAVAIAGFPGILGIAAMQNVDRQNEEIKKADDQAKATAANQAQRLYEIQHPNIVGQMTMGGAAETPVSATSQQIGPTSSDGSQTTFTSPAAMMKAQKNAPTYSKPGGAGAALAQQAQDQSNFRLPIVAGLTFGGS
jgi:hypothetical protein